jgi:hypothetical protein
MLLVLHLLSFAGVLAFVCFMLHLLCITDISQPLMDA